MKRLSLIACIVIAVTAIVAFAQKERPVVTDWQREHSGVPYVNQDLHYVLPDTVVDADGNTYTVNPEVVGRPRPIIAIVVSIDRDPVTFTAQNIDGRLLLTRNDLIDEEGKPLPVYELLLLNVPPDNTRRPGFWAHIPDPKVFKILGR